MKTSLKKLLWMIIFCILVVTIGQILKLDAISFILGSGYILGLNVLDDYYG